MAVGKYSDPANSNWFTRLGSWAHAPELGLSELFGRGDTRAMRLAKQNADTRAVGALVSGFGSMGQFGAFYSPNAESQAGQDYFNTGSAVLNSPLSYRAPNYVNMRQQANKAAGLDENGNPIDTGGGGKGGTPSDPNYGWWMGTRYNLDDLNERNAYGGARTNYINDVFGRKLTNAQQSAQGGIEGVDRDLGNLVTNKSDYLTNWQDQYNTLGKNYEGRMAGISNRYSNLGDIYQSSQGVRETGATDLFNKGKTTANREKTRSLDSIAQQESDLGKEKLDYGTWWEDQQRQIDLEKSQELDAIYSALDESGSTAEAQRLAGMSDVNGRIRANQYSPTANMAGLAESGALGTSLGGIKKQGVSQAQSGQVAGALNKYNDLLDQTGDPQLALQALSPAERELLSQMGL